MNELLNTNATYVAFEDAPETEAEFLDQLRERMFDRPALYADALVVVSNNTENASLLSTFLHDHGDRSVAAQAVRDCAALVDTQLDRYFQYPPDIAQGIDNDPQVMRLRESLKNVRSGARPNPDQENRLVFRMRIARLTTLLHLLDSGQRQPPLDNPSGQSSQHKIDAA